MISTGINGALATPEAGGTSETGGMTTMAWGADQWRAWWWALGAAALVLAVAYAPNLGELGRVWREDDNYQHGFLVIPIALFILWRRMVEIPWTEPREVASTPWWGWGLLAVILAVRAVAYEWSFQWLETATILPAIACLTWAFGGWPLLYRAWPAILFLVFMLPLPLSVNGMIALPLQTAGGDRQLHPAPALGVLGDPGGEHPEPDHAVRHEALDVALACSGLKMLMTLAATVTATIMLLPLPRWKRFVLLASAVPIALISNMSRIVTTGWCYYYIEGERGTHLGARHLRLDDDAAGPDPGGARAEDPVVAGPRDDRGRAGRTQDDPPATRRQGEGRQEVAGTRALNADAAAGPRPPLPAPGPRAPRPLRPISHLPRRVSASLPRAVARGRDEWSGRGVAPGRLAGRDIPLACHRPSAGPRGMTGLAAETPHPSDVG